MTDPIRHESRTPRRRRLRTVLIGAGVSLCLVGIALAASPPKAWREYVGMEYSAFPLPSDYMVPAEWTFGRLMYPPCAGCSRYGGSFGDWRYGGTTWTIDYPSADRHIVQMVRRLTAVDARSVEQPVSLEDEDDVFNWPWLYAVEVGTWDLSDEQAAKLREYLLRGGFLMVDDFHGTIEWSIFMESMQRVFPDRPVVEIPDTDQIFHTFWDTVDRQQIPGLQFVYTSRTYEQDGYTARWRGIYDDEGRVMVAICHNMDLGDAVEHSDNPLYPEDYSAQAMRIFINYIIYSMSH